MPSKSYSPIDVPFNLRHTCWFCGEPSSAQLLFPRSAKSSKHADHPPLEIPACRECDSIKYPARLTSIWELRSSIKQALISKYAKHLGIGENWTEQELIDSDFSGAILGGFGKSAWHMYEIAKQRVAFEGWELSVDSLPLDCVDETSSFEFNGTHYSSLSTCIDYFVKATSIDEELLTQLVGIVTPARFEYALKIAKLNKRISNSQRTRLIEEISLQEAEKQQAELESESRSGANTFVEEVAVSGAIAPIFAIQWAIEQGITNLGELCNLEDEYFDAFAHLGGAAAFASYNGLQLYLEAREDSNWIEENDPNKELWIN
ncbi:hypothetical protein L4C54_23230 [Vibrio lamellibrachiae]|uniref:hypothetical protein n=1 Tax=Vibrio lamellibrachiae TaxID=2910253 RepID=UPI003D0CC536